jgi:thiol reductant ABC exporter CydC subunit
VTTIPITTDAEQRETLAPLGRTLSLTRPAAGRLALATLLGAGAMGASVGLLATSAWLISRASERPGESALGIAIAGVQFFALSRGLLRYGERLVGHDAAFRILAEVRVRVYARLEALAPTGLLIFRSGDLLARLVQDVDSLQDVLLRAIPPFASAVVVGAATVSLVWLLLPEAGLILLVTLVLAATVVPWLTGSLTRRSESRQAGVRGELAAAVTDLIEGAPDLAVFGGTKAQLEKIADADAELTRVASASADTAGIGLALITLLTGLATWAILLVGIPAVHEGHLDGVNLAVIALIPLAAFELVVGLPVATQSLQRARSSAQRLFTVMDASAPVTEPAMPAALPTPPYELTPRSMSARYPNQCTRAVDELDARFPSGHRVGVIGPSGAGKSALAAVLLRFLPYEDGSVSLNDTALQRLDSDEVRSVIGLVAQDAHIFDTTLAENLRVGRHEAHDGELRSALDQVGLGGWLEKLPDGLSTQLGELGARLSGGQRQRVAVARAVLANFPVLVLDEPAEHLDQRTADAMLGDLLDLTSGRSTVLISHRLAALDGMDEVMVLDHGRVVERGTHDELLAACGRYAELWWREMRAGSSTVLPSDEGEREPAMAADDVPGRGA